MVLSNFRVNEHEHQFEMEAEGQLALLEFHKEGEKLYLTHTEVPEKFRGQGVAAHLVKEVLAYARKEGLFVVPLCSYVSYYINNHPEWFDVLSEGYKM